MFLSKEIFSAYLLKNMCILLSIISVLGKDGEFLVKNSSSVTWLTLQGGNDFTTAASEATLGQAFSEGSTIQNATVLANWVHNDLFANDPFPSHPGQVPYVNLGAGDWVAYSRRQVCYIAAKTLSGATFQEQSWNGLTTLLSLCNNKAGYASSFAQLVAVCASDPSLRDNMQGPIILVTKPKTAQTPNLNVNLTVAGIRTCRYQDGSGGKSWSGVPNVPSEGCQQPTSTTPGSDFMTGGIRGQAIQDISADWVGGYILDGIRPTGNCDPGGGQDERLLFYLPEVSTLAWFLGPQDEHPQIRVPVWFLGVRRVLNGLDGTGRFSQKMKFRADVPMTSDLVEVTIGDEGPYDISSTKSFLAFDSGNQGICEASSNQTKLCRLDQSLQQRIVDSSQNYNFQNEIKRWYSAVALTQYSSDIQSLLKKIVKSLGTGPYGSGLWWGDSNMFFIAMWAAHAAAANTWGVDTPLPLDYYIYSSFTENPGNQCYILKKDDCIACIKACNLPNGAYWLPDGVEFEEGNPCVIDYSRCPTHGIGDIINKYNGTTAQTLVKNLINTQMDVSGQVFDGLLSDD